MMTSIETELAKIAQRIEARTALEQRDRARQAELCRALIDQGQTWDQVQAAAHISRNRLRNAVLG